MLRVRSSLLMTVPSSILTSMRVPRKLCPQIILSAEVELNSTHRCLGERDEPVRHCVPIARGASDLLCRRQFLTCHLGVDLLNLGRKTSPLTHVPRYLSG